MLADGAGLPDDLDPDVATSPLLIQNDLLDYQSSNLLAFRWSGCRRMPQVRQVLAQCQDLPAIAI